MEEERTASSYQKSVRRRRRRDIHHETGTCRTDGVEIVSSVGCQNASKTLTVQKKGQIQAQPEETDS